MKTVILGASGYAGAELLRLVSRHSSLEVVGISGESAVGMRVRDLYPGAPPEVASMQFVSTPDLLSKVERGIFGHLAAIFLALPHGVAESIVPQLLGLADVVVDLSADFRLKDPQDYEIWYGRTHSAPELLSQAVYGLPELSREGLIGAPLIAVAGCYVTAVTLAILPFLRNNAVERAGIVADAASGVSGAGRSLKAENLYLSVDSSFSAYGLKSHRHTVEMQRNLGVELLFTPHLAPMQRGILATCYLRPTPEFEAQILRDDKAPDSVLAEMIRNQYVGDPFANVSSKPPSTRAVQGTNEFLGFATFDERTGWILSLGAVDNLTKGAAGQAIQCANIALSLEETTGLTEGGVWP